MVTNVAQPTTSRTPEQRQAAIDRATAKALEQARAKNIPTLLRKHTSRDGLQTTAVWNVSSRITAGTIYLVDMTADCDGIRTLCSCDGASAGRICWHRSAVRLAVHGDIPHHDRRVKTPANITNADIFGALG